MSELDALNQKYIKEVNGKTEDGANALYRHKQLLQKPGVKQFCEFIDTFARATKQLGLSERGNGNR